MFLSRVQDKKAQYTSEYWQYRYCFVRLSTADGKGFPKITLLSKIDAWDGEIFYAIWFNPPYSLNVKTNVGKEFLKLVDKAFPPDNPLHKIFNRQTVKVGYMCMPNMKTEVARHNNQVLREDQPQAAIPACKCEGGPPNCPVMGDCQKSGVVYQASVEEKQTGKVETYTIYRPHMQEIQKKMEGT